MSHPTRSSDRARLTFVMLCIMAFVMYIDRANISVAAPLIRKELGLTNTSLGLTFSAFGIAYAVFMIPGGWLSDRIGARKGLLVWGIVWSIATIATGFIGSLVTLAIARFAVGVGEAPIYPSAARMIANVMPESRRGTAQGVMHACGRTASALAPLIVTALIVYFSWRWAFIILGIVTICFMFFMYSCLNSAHKKDEQADELERLAAAANGDRSQHASPAPAGKHAGPDTSKHARPVNWPDLIRRVWPATAACFCHGWILWFFLNWVPSFFAQRYGMKIEHSAVFSTFVLLGGTVGTAAGGMLSDWYLTRTGNRLKARRNVIIFGFLSALVGLIPLMLTRNVTICTASLCFAFFCSEIADSPLWVIGSEIAPEHSATSSALTFAGMALAGAISPVVVGYLLDASNGNWLVAFGASMVVMVLGPMFAMRIRLEEPPVEPPARLDRLAVGTTR